MVEYAYPHPNRYDGVSEIYCQTEDKRWGRFCGKPLLNRLQSEPPFCEGKKGAHQTPKQDEK